MLPLNAVAAAPAAFGSKPMASRSSVSFSSGSVACWMPADNRRLPSASAAEPSRAVPRLSANVFEPSDSWPAPSAACFTSSVTWVSAVPITCWPTLAPTWLSTSRAAFCPMTDAR